MDEASRKTAASRKAEALCKTGRATTFVWQDEAKALRAGTKKADRRAVRL